MALDRVLLVAQGLFMVAMLLTVLRHRRHSGDQGFALWEWPELWLFLFAGSMTLRAHLGADPFVPLAYIAFGAAVVAVGLRVFRSISREAST